MSEMSNMYPTPPSDAGLPTRTTTLSGFERLSGSELTPIRHRIFDFLQERRVLHFKASSSSLPPPTPGLSPAPEENDDEEIIFLKAPAKPPITLSINRESRAYALRSYKAFGGAYSDFYVWPEIDIFWIEYSMVLEESYLRELRRRELTMGEEEWKKLTGPRLLGNPDLLVFVGREAEKHEEERRRRGMPGPPKGQPPTRVEKLLNSAEAVSALRDARVRDRREARTPRVGLEDMKLMQHVLLLHHGPVPTYHTDVLSNPLRKSVELHLPGGIPHRALHCCPSLAEVYIAQWDCRIGQDIESMGLEDWQQYLDKYMSNYHSRFGLPKDHFKNGGAAVKDAPILGMDVKAFDIRDVPL